MTSPWNDLTLGDSLEVLIDNRGKNPPYTDEGIPCVSGMTVTEKGLDFSRARYVSYETWSDWMPQPLQSNDVILTSEAPLGRAALVRDSRPVALTQRVFGLRGKSGVLDSRFLYYAFQTNQVQADLQGRATGTTVLGIRQPALRSVRIPAPSFKQQQSIAEVLGALDDKIAANTKLASTSADLALAYVADAAPSVALSEIVAHRKESVAPQKITAASVAHFSLPAFDNSEQPEIVRPHEIKSNKHLVSQPSVLVSKLNPRFPRIWDVPSTTNVPSLASTEFLVLDPLFSTSSVLWAILNQPHFGRDLENKVAGTSGSHQRVKPADLLATLVVDPRSLSEVIKASVDELVRVKHVAGRENFQLAETRDTLLPQLMSGKLRVKDAEKVVEGAV